MKGLGVVRVTHAQKSTMGQRKFDYMEVGFDHLVTVFLGHPINQKQYIISLTFRMGMSLKKFHLKTINGTVKSQKKLPRKHWSWSFFLSKRYVSVYQVYQMSFSYTFPINADEFCGGLAVLIHSCV